MEGVTNAAIYCRISYDREGAGLGVARQRSDCEALAAQRNWTVTDVFEDNDISAYSGRRRPGYEQLLQHIRAGAVDVVVAWHTDRLHRSPTELEDYITACEARNVATITVSPTKTSSTGRSISLPSRKTRAVLA